MEPLTHSLFPKLPERSLMLVIGLQETSSEMVVNFLLSLTKCPYFTGPLVGEV